MKYLKIIILVAIANTFCNAQTITTIAGSGEAGFQGDGDAATASQLNFPFCLGIDATGNLYVGEHYNYRIRKIETTGLINTIAGTGTVGYSGDNIPAATANIDAPVGIAVDGSGNIYFADYGNHRIRKIDAATGTITTVAGTGVVGYSGDGGVATSAQIETPSGIAVDGSGNIYFTERNNNIVRMVDNTGHISTFAGTGIQGYTGDGAAATACRFTLPYGIAVDGSGNIYVSDTGNNAIRKILAASGNIITVAGNGIPGYSGDNGTATSAQINSPFGVAVDPAGNIYISDHNNNCIRKVDTSGNMSTKAGIGGRGFGGDGGSANAAGLNGPVGIVVTASGVVYFADAFNQRIRVIK